MMLGINVELAAVIFATRCVEKGVHFSYFTFNRQVVQIEPPYISLVKRK